MTTAPMWAFSALFCQVRSLGQHMCDAIRKIASIFCRDGIAMIKSELLPLINQGFQSKNTLKPLSNERQQLFY